MVETMESLQLKQEVKESLQNSLMNSECFDEETTNKVIEVFDTFASYYTFKKIGE